MTSAELTALFTVTGTTPTDFINWAAGYGVRIHKATISRHEAGTQRITGFAVLAYRWFFSQATKKKI